MVKKFEILFPFILIGLLLGSLLFLIEQCNAKPSPGQVRIVKETNTLIDTMIVQGKTPDPIIIEKQVYIQRVDTIYLDKKDVIINPFKVCFDTVLQAEKDTINFCYKYPEEQLFLALKKAPPQIQVITITKDNYVEESAWNKVLYFVGGAGSAYFTQYLFK